MNQESMILICNIDGKVAEVEVPKLGLSAAMKMGITILDEKNEVIKNRFGGGSIELDPVAVAVYDYFLGSENIARQFQSQSTKTGQDAWVEAQKCLDWFINYRPKAYQILLD